MDKKVERILLKCLMVVGIICFIGSICFFIWWYLKFGTFIEYVNKYPNFTINLSELGYT